MDVKRWILSAAGAALVLATAAGGSENAAAAPATGSLEELATAANCRPQIQTDADEIRQGVCRTTAGKFILATFATPQGRREWLDGAEAYGGVYLVGPTWVAVGGAAVVDDLRGRLGGAVEEGMSHHMGPDMEMAPQHPS